MGRAAKAKVPHPKVVFVLRSMARATAFFPPPRWLEEVTSQQRRCAAKYGHSGITLVVSIIVLSVLLDNFTQRLVVFISDKFAPVGNLSE